MEKNNNNKKSSSYYNGSKSSQTKSSQLRCISPTPCPSRSNGPSPPPHPIGYTASYNIYHIRYGDTNNQPETFNINIQ